MVSTKDLLINNNCNDSHDSIDWLSNRVQNLLEKTLICQKSNQSTLIDNRDVSIQQQQQKQADLDIVSSSTNNIRMPLESNIMLINTNNDRNPEMTFNYDQFDDLTEYYPIEKFHQNIASITIRENESNGHLSDIISFHKNFLNSQINHLKRLSYDLIRIERYLLKSSEFNHGNSTTQSKCHCCNHGNHVERIISNVRRKDHSLFHENLDTVVKSGNLDKQTKILQHSISMIVNRQINKDMTNDNDDLVDKSVQTSFNANVEQTSNDSNHRSLSWFLHFVDDDEHYRIFDAQSFNLSEIFEQKQGRFIHRSLMRSLRIKDNCRLRIETTDQRKDEIVQVFLLTKRCHENDERSKRKSATSGNSRPLSPITRRVFTHQQMRKQTEKLYRKLPESKNRRNDGGRRQDEAKKRRMMAEIFKQKLKDNAVRGRLNWPITSQAISA
ncbi:hypothetical protein BLA29_004278 [Euroglyphus maynei]|uniref:ALMS motif domain-containing protein n=1 Tax=Euroglyphus maynei TaxID=6958 RepID=A0A1Y3BMV1_EURMA|nr:hypothetical protein BLA29_004278 [Euroglyphus maynei]